MTTQTLSTQDYERAFETERARSYPMVDALEARLGYALDRERLETAARVLACPVKAHAPNWQHGRVLYAHVRAYLAAHPTPSVNALDIGTAKGFSALCLLWALQDAPECHEWVVTSLDVRDPNERLRRNTIAEVDGYKTLREILAPWPEADAITFLKMAGQKWLTSHPERLHVAFVDGKHSYDAVSWEVSLLASRQQSGDLAIFDDVQIPDVARAVRESRSYAFTTLEILPERAYAIGVRL